MSAEKTDELRSRTYYVSLCKKVSALIDKDPSEVTPYSLESALQEHFNISVDKTELARIKTGKRNTPIRDPDGALSACNALMLHGPDETHLWRAMTVTSHEEAGRLLSLESNWAKDSLEHSVAGWYKTFNTPQKYKTIDLNGYVTFPYTSVLSLLTRHPERCLSLLSSVITNYRMEFPAETRLFNSKLQFGGSKYEALFLLVFLLKHGVVKTRLAYFGIEYTNIVECADIDDRPALDLSKENELVRGAYIRYESSCKYALSVPLSPFKRIKSRNV